MAIISSDEITLTRVDDGYSPTVDVEDHDDDPDIDENEIKITVTDIRGTEEKTIMKADTIYEALQDVEVFNDLTDGGTLEGMFTDPISGHAYFNGTYLKAEGATIGGFSIGSNFIRVGDTTRETDITEEYDEWSVESEYEGEPNIDVGGLTYSGLGGVVYDLGTQFEVDMKDSIDYRTTTNSHQRLLIKPQSTDISGGWSYVNSYDKFSTTKWHDNGISSVIRDSNNLYAQMDFTPGGLFVNGVNVLAPSEEILAFGNYTTLNTDITLTKPYTDFRFIMFRFGGGGGEGTVSIYVPTNNIYNGTNYSAHQAIWYVISNGSPVVCFATVKFTDDNKIQITSYTGGGTNVLRQVKGIY